jgi:hypothetical protein
MTTFAFAEHVRLAIEDPEVAQCVCGCPSCQSTWDQESPAEQVSGAVRALISDWVRNLPYQTPDVLDAERRWRHGVDLVGRITQAMRPPCTECGGQWAQHEFACSKFEPF